MQSSGRAAIAALPEDYIHYHCLISPRQYNKSISHIEIPISYQ